MKNIFPVRKFFAHTDKFIKIFIGFLFGALLISPILFSRPSNVVLNQFFISDQRLLRGDVFSSPFWEGIIGSYRFGLQQLFGSAPAQNVDYKNPQAFFDYIFTRIPSVARVYPSETYYYYRVQLPDILIAGNIRLLDAHLGILHFGYFDANNPHNPASDSWHGDVGKEQGLAVTTINDHTFDVFYQNRTVRFILNDFLTEKPKSLALLPEEEFISQIYDESGSRLALLYNNSTNSFYFVRNPDVVSFERLKEREESIVIGATSGFAYYRDKELNRDLLFGVSTAEIYKNSYYDGPFDQVPPRLPIKAKLEAAYPYVKFRGGIDEHGNFISLEGSRVAISPYVNYESASDLLTRVKDCLIKKETVDMSSCLTYEYKKDFHKTLDVNGQPLTSLKGNHAVFMSQSWPANHEGERSLSWPDAHTAKNSQNWPKNHTGKTSTIR